MNNPLEEDNDDFDPAEILDSSEYYEPVNKNCVPDYDAGRGFYND